MNKKVKKIEKGKFELKQTVHKLVHKDETIQEEGDEEDERSK